MVTGGSRGIGAATARLAAARGHAVCVDYTSNEAAAQRVVDEIVAAGGRSIAVQADVADEADVLRLFATCDAELGPVTALVNNAGVVAPAARVDEMDAERIMRLLRINVLGSFLAAREAIRRMSTRHGGGGRRHRQHLIGCRPAGFARRVCRLRGQQGRDRHHDVGLAKEVATEGIRVVGIRPGLIDTDIHESQGAIGRLAAARAAGPGRARRVGRGSRTGRRVDDRRRGVVCHRHYPGRRRRKVGARNSRAAA